MKQVKLGEIATIYNGTSINQSVKKQKYMNDVPGWNYIATKDVGVDGKITYQNGVIIPYSEKGFRIAPAGSVFVCSEGGSAGKKTAVLQKDVCFGNKLFAIVNDKGLYNEKYLFYYTRFERFREQFKLLATSLMGGISVKNLSAIKVPLCSLQDQHRIVSRIEELFSQLDSGVETLKKTKEQLKVYRQAVLKEAFEGAFTQHLTIEDHLEWYKGDIINLPPIPKEWRYIYLSELGELARGKSKHRPRNDAKLFENGKYPFLQTGDIKSANKYVTVYEKMYGDFGLNQSRLWKKGTLCITIAANIAETAFLGLDACFPDSIVGFTANETVLMEYVRYFIEASKIRLWAFAPATAQKNINLKTLENLVIPYCCINEQKKVVEEIESRLSVCDSIEITIDTALQEAEALRQSILKQAFEGGL